MHGRASRVGPRTLNPNSRQNRSAKTGEFAFARGETCPDGRFLISSVAALQTFVGIDVSKAKLDVGCLPGGECRELDNDPEGRKQLIEWLSSKSGCLLVVGPGGYERNLVYAAQDAQLEMHFAIRGECGLARGIGQLHKTDPIDAHVLALFRPARAAAAAREHSGQAAGIGVAGGTASPMVELHTV